MAWTWRYEDAGGQAVIPAGWDPQEHPAQGDAETWIGENWRELFAAGVEQVSLLEADRVVYGPMSLRPPG